MNMARAFITTFSSSSLCLFLSLLSHRPAPLLPPRSRQSWGEAEAQIQSSLGSD